MEGKTTIRGKECDRKRRGEGKESRTLVTRIVANLLEFILWYVTERFNSDLETFSVKAVLVATHLGLIFGDTHETAARTQESGRHARSCSYCHCKPHDRRARTAGDVS